MAKQLFSLSKQEYKFEEKNTFVRFELFTNPIEFSEIVIDIANDDPTAMPKQIRLDNEILTKQEFETITSAFIRMQQELTIIKAVKRMESKNESN